MSKIKKLISHRFGAVRAGIYGADRAGFSLWRRI